MSGANIGSEMAARMVAGRRAYAAAQEDSAGFTSDESIGRPAPAAPSQKRSAAARAAADYGGGASEGTGSEEDGSGRGAMRATFDDNSALEEPSRQRRRVGPHQKYTGLTQSEADQAHLAALAGTQTATTAAARPTPMALGDCPVCSERISSLYEEGQSRGANAKARSAMQQTIVDPYKLIFHTETTLRAYMDDEQLLPLLLQMHERLIERPATQNQIAHRKWTLADLQRHFDVRQPHILDPVREVRATQAAVRRAMYAVQPHVLERDPNQPAVMMVNKNGVAALNAMASQNAKLAMMIARMQTCAEQSVSNAIFSLVSTVQRSTDASGVDQALLRDPALAAGTMVMGETATQAPKDESVGADMYKISGF